jgi:broad specificity phosphatase PhoE
MKTTVFLIRHGLIDNPENVMYGRNIDFKLSKEGEEQILSLALKLKGKGAKVDRIYASPLTRAIQSANIIGEVFGVSEFTIVEDFTDTNIAALFGSPRSKQVLTFKPEYIKKGNEHPWEIIKRMRRAFERVVDDNQGKTIVVVGHGDPLRFLLYSLVHAEYTKPNIKSLVHSKYIHKGTAVRLVIDKDKILEKEIIS